MEKTVNRVEAGLYEWLQREERFKELFGANIIQKKHFDETKLMHFRDLYQNTGKDATKDEKLSRNILKGEMNRLERNLYPSVLQRLFNRALLYAKDLFERPAQVPKPVDRDVLTIRKAAFVNRDMPGGRNYKKAESPDGSFSLNEREQAYKKATEKNEKKQKLTKEMKVDSLVPKKRTGHAKGITR